MPPDPHLTPTQARGCDEGIALAPWTPEQVEALNRFQQSGRFHPFTCPTAHPEGRDLVAAEDGWHCPRCPYTQDWAHAFQAARELPESPFAAEKTMATDAALTGRELEAAALDGELHTALTGRALDAAVAEALGCKPRLVAWLSYEEYQCGCPDNRHNGESECEGYLLEYGSDPAASAVLREELRRRGWAQEARLNASGCALAVLGQFFDELLVQELATGDTPEQALALAALAALRAVRTGE